jgi:hypothetical protein
MMMRAYDGAVLARFTPFICVLAAIGCTGTQQDDSPLCDAETPCDDGLPCDVLTGTCPLECAQDSDCDDPTEPICAVDTTCRDCNDSDECAAKDPMAAICDNGTCRGCTVDVECVSPTAPFCDTTTDLCVACLVDDACDSDDPVCDGGACRGCIENTECPEDVCLDGGTCAPRAEMVLVSMATGNGDPGCGVESQTPCSTIALGYIRAAQMNRGIVRIDDGEHTLRVQGIAVDVRIVVPVPGAATYEPSDTSFPGFLVVEGASLIVDGLTMLHPGSAPPVAAVQCGGSSDEIRVRRARIDGWLDGVRSDACGFVEVTGSTITNQDRYGVFVRNTRAVIKNNIISYNGSLSLGDGGIHISQGDSFTTELSFNTLVGNLVAGGQPTAGIVCAGNFTAHSNIVYGNMPSEVQRLTAQVSTLPGSCSHTYSTIEAMPPNSDNNISDDPSFIDGDEERDVAGDASDFDLHLMSDSPCIDGADPSSTESVDIDGDPRPAGAANDIGADEAG